MQTTDEDVSPIEVLIAKLQKCRSGEVDLPSEFHKEITSSTGNANGNTNAIANADAPNVFQIVVNFLHHQLDDEKHTEEQVKNVIDIFPQALFMLDYNSNYDADCFPIQSAACYFASDGRSAISFIPLLAYEGSRFNSHGREVSRGGLFYEIPYGEEGESESSITFLVEGFDNNSNHDDRRKYDSKCTRILKKLRNLNLLQKDDIQEHFLLAHALNVGCEQRFNYLARWDPDALRDTSFEDGKFLLHASLEKAEPRECFGFVLKAGMQHFSNHFGFLFRELHGQTACEAAFDVFGKDDTMTMIRQCIPAMDENNHHHSHILNYVARHCPHLMKDMVNCYQPNVSQKDPQTGLYPFMLAASFDTCDLSSVYLLLHHNPRLLNGGCKSSCNLHKMEERQGKS